MAPPGLPSPGGPGPCSAEEGKKLALTTVDKAWARHRVLVQKVHVTEDKTTFPERVEVAAAAARPSAGPAPRGEPPSAPRRAPQRRGGCWSVSADWRGLCPVRGPGAGGGCWLDLSVLVPLFRRWRYDDLVLWRKGTGLGKRCRTKRPGLLRIQPSMAPAEEPTPGSPRGSCPLLGQVLALRGLRGTRLLEETQLELPLGLGAAGLGRTRDVCSLRGWEGDHSLSSSIPRQPCSSGSLLRPQPDKRQSPLHPRVALAEPGAGAACWDLLSF